MNAPHCYIVDKVTILLTQITSQWKQTNNKIPNCATRGAQIPSTRSHRHI